MIIDFHTHIFPDKIATKTISMLAAKGGFDHFSDGSVGGLLGEMEKAGADISVTLPVMTSPKQFDSINRFAAEVTEKYKNTLKRLISFAGIHPDCEDIEGKMKWIAESGFLGVKLHPDYQETDFNDERYIRIIRCAKELDLIVVTHAGYDAAYRGAPIRCTPEMIFEVIKKVGHPKLVLAHMGGCDAVERVIDLICGEDVYFDTAYLLRFINEDIFRRFIQKHGEDKILFASDSPWSDMAEDIKIIRSFELGKETEEKLFAKNAMSLLGL